jgi:hypothetical protein
MRLASWAVLTWAVLMWAELVGKEKIALGWAASAGPVSGYWPKKA